MGLELLCVGSIELCGSPSQITSLTSYLGVQFCPPNSSPILSTMYFGICNMNLFRFIAQSNHFNANVRVSVAKKKPRLPTTCKFTFWRQFLVRCLLGRDFRSSPSHGISICSQSSQTSSGSLLHASIVI